MSKTRITEIKMTDDGITLWLDDEHKSVIGIKFNPVKITVNDDRIESTKVLEPVPAHATANMRRG